LVRSQSDPPETAALLVTEGTALAPGVTVRVINPGSVDDVVHETICPLTTHVHPVPEAETNASVAGSVSVTVIGPMLVTPLFPKAIR
jgi:hypothetical protein